MPFRGTGQSQVRLQVPGLGIPNIAVLLDGGIRRVPLATMMAGTEVRKHTVFILGRGWGCCFGQLGAGQCPGARLATLVLHTTPPQPHQQHSARGTDTAISVARRAGVVSTRAVTGEEAGAGGIDKLPGTEGPLWGAVVSRAVPEAPLLADTAEERENQNQAQWPLPPGPTDLARASGIQMLGR